MAAPYAAETLTYSVMLPYSSVNILGMTITVGNVLSLMNVATGTITLSNMLFQLNAVLMFAAGQKELGNDSRANYNQIRQSIGMKGGSEGD